jgi:hypothetical protein
VTLSLVASFIVKHSLFILDLPKNQKPSLTAFPVMPPPSKNIISCYNPSCSFFNTGNEKAPLKCGKCKLVTTVIQSDTFFDLHAFVTGQLTTAIK